MDIHILLGYIKYTKILSDHHSCINIFEFQATAHHDKGTSSKKMSEGRYAFSLTTFSPSGKLVQIEHALTAVSAGVTAIGIKGFKLFNDRYANDLTQGNKQHNKASNGIVIATEKKIATFLIEDEELSRVSQISTNIGVVYSGMGPDARVLVDKARKSAQEYKRVYCEEPPVVMLVKEVASIMQEYTQRG